MKICPILFILLTVQYIGENKHNLGGTAYRWLVSFLLVQSLLFTHLKSSLRAFCVLTGACYVAKEHQLHVREASSIYKQSFWHWGKYILVEKDALNNPSNIIKIVLNIIRKKHTFNSVPSCFSVTSQWKLLPW